MPFWSKPQKKDIEAVKQAVVPQEKSQSAEMPKFDLGKLPERPRFAPLFVKIDRYREILNSIENLKSILLGVRDLLNLMQQLDRIKIESETLLNKNIQEVIMNISNMDKEFIRPKGVNVEETAHDMHDNMGYEKVGSYIGDLQRELDNLKSQLQTLR
ncbi:MAG: hypothetical protein KKB25_00705 [Nanoarchaeota archaeon]|nr:hypothetical protein [Nanoarchaeota archaeon]